MDIKLLTTFASVVAIMTLLMADSSWATHRNLPENSYSSVSHIFDVMDYGALADAANDDQQAFKGAWGAACMAPSDAVLQVPSDKKFLVRPVTFLGPCKSHVTVQITGTIVAPKERSAWNSNELDLWLRFSDISGLTIEGEGVIDGQGQAWWSESCKVNGQSVDHWMPWLEAFEIEPDELLQVNFKHLKRMQSSKPFLSSTGIESLLTNCFLPYAAGIESLLTNSILPYAALVFIRLFDSTTPPDATSTLFKDCVNAAPPAMSITRCSNVVIRNLHFLNSQQMHLVVLDSSDIQLSGLQIEAPEESPNTDGIHIQRVQNAQINNCVIRTGDDCISISSGSSSIAVKNITCGPGHGISIGSLGKNGEPAKIDGILVQNINFIETSNGARIKSWQGGSGYARNIRFEDITVNNVMNPIIIDQYYCDSTTPCKTQKSGVQIQDVTFKNIHGTSSRDVAVNLSCSKTVACTGITLEDVKIVSTTANVAKSICVNALGMALGTISPPSCLNN